MRNDSLSLGVFPYLLHVACPATFAAVGSVCIDTCTVSQSAVLSLPTGGLQGARDR